MPYRSTTSRTAPYPSSSFTVSAWPFFSRPMERRPAVLLVSVVHPRTRIQTLLNEVENVARSRFVNQRHGLPPPAVRMNAYGYPSALEPHIYRQYIRDPSSKARGRLKGDFERRLVRPVEPPASLPVVR